MYKNQAGQKIPVYAYDTNTGSPKTGDDANITAQISLDGGASAATNDVNPTELDATNQPGVYLFDPSQAETNADFGVLTAVSSTGSVHIEPVTFYTVVGSNVGIVASTVADGAKLTTQTLADTKLDRNADLIESQRGAHTMQGDMFYVDPFNGNDTTGDGSRALPYATIQAAHDDLVTDSAHDVIYLIAGGSGTTIHTTAAPLTISKRYCFIRGPGRDFIVTRTGNGNTFEITGDGCEISGIQVGTAGAGAGDGINVTDADFHRIHHCWFLDTQGDGIHVNRGENTRIHDNHFFTTGVTGGGQGVHISGTGGSASNNAIYDNEFQDVDGTAILIEQGTILNTLIHDNTIHDAGGWGIDIGGASTNAVVWGNTLGNNASGDIQDGGTTSVIKNNYDVTDGVWDELLTGATHNTPTSAGRRLREIASMVVWAGTAQGAGVNGNQIQLDTGASAVDGSYDPTMIAIILGTGEGQSRQIFDYVGSTRMATVDRTWKVNPDATSEFVIYANPGREHVNEGLAQAGASMTITLNTLASATDDAYNGQIVFIRSGTGDDQARWVTDYVGATKVATVNREWDITPDSTSAYAMLPSGMQNLDGALETTSQSIKAVTDKLDGMLIIDGAVYQYTTNALENAPGGMATVNILPLFAVTTESGLQSILRLSAYQYAIFEDTFGVYDNSKPRQPIDLSGIDLTWIAWVEEDPGTIILSMTTTEGKITVGGTNDNLVTLLGDTTDTAVAYKSLKWRLIGTTNDTQYANGYIDINESAQPE